ncbi:MAG: hypothetical protein J2P36_12725 [Ktedonobacteraceae bacterium]|nr:hypothetical protein [Ktedonobacteraceae bacterium]
MQKARDNRTWIEEDQPLTDMQSSWNSYDRFDGQIRGMANNLADPNHLLNAERLSTGQSNQAFGAFTDAVDRLSQANQQHFDSTYQQTQSSLMAYILLCALLYPIIGLLAVWGVFLRLKDF